MNDNVILFSFKYKEQAKTLLPESKKKKIISAEQPTSWVFVIDLLFAHLFCVEIRCSSVSSSKIKTWNNIIAASCTPRPETLKHQEREGI